MKKDSVKAADKTEAATKKAAHVVKKDTVKAADKTAAATKKAAKKTEHAVKWIRVGPYSTVRITGCSSMEALFAVNTIRWYRPAGSLGTLNLISFSVCSAMATLVSILSSVR